MQEFLGSDVTNEDSILFLRKFTQYYFWFRYFKIFSVLTFLNFRKKKYKSTRINWLHLAVVRIQINGIH